METTPLSLSPPRQPPRGADLVAGLKQSLKLSSQDACAPGLAGSVSVLGGAYIAACSEHVEAATHFLTALSSVIWCVHSCSLGS